MYTNISQSKQIEYLLHKRSVWNRWQSMDGHTDANLAGAYLADTALVRANLARATLTRANLADANFSGANLAGANLTGANLTRANLADANLTRATLTGANPAGATLDWANLTRATLTGATIDWANLTRATLTWANLAGANLTGANLTGANLTGANLTGAYLAGAYLAGTCLDPTLPCSAPGQVIAALEEHGITPNARGNFIAYRTQRSRYVGNTVYQVGRTYKAPWFSTDETTPCHPGLYFTGKDSVEDVYRYGLVAVVVNVRDVVVAGSKLRCRKFRVTKVIEEAR